MKFSKALVVDDYTDVASVTARTLVLLGIANQVEIASSGEEAWTMLASAHFDLVIADQRLPEMDGITLPLYRLDPREPSAAAKIRLLLHCGQESIICG